VLATLSCLPIMAVVGASMGSKKAAPEEDIDRAEAQLRPEFQAQGSANQKVLRDHVVQYAAEVGFSPFAMLDDQGPVKADEAPQYRLPEDQGADVVIEIALLDITATTLGIKALEYEFVLTARGRIIRVANNAVLDSFYKRAYTVSRSTEEWAADNGKLLVAELGRANREIAEAFIDEWLLIEKRPQTAPRAKATSGTSAVRDEPPTSKASNRVVPAYMLHPLYPELLDRGMKSVAHNWPLKKIQIDSLRPALRWEPFPRPHDFADASFQHGGPREVTYDLRIFRGVVVPGGQVAFYKQIVPIEPVLSETGLTSPSYQPPELLEPCAIYFWTVRARYLLEGRPRATEWAWPYSWQTPGHPWQFRRSWPTWSSYSVLKAPRGWPEYVPFKTPPRDGEKCDSR
ncbi:MAG: hypothetical protein ACREUQ_03105, partial [Burkholderiales bacterium]